MKQNKVLYVGEPFGLSPTEQYRLLSSDKKRLEALRILQRAEFGDHSFYGYYWAQIVRLMFRIIRQMEARKP